MGNSYKFDDDFSFVKDESRISRIIRKIFFYFFASLTIAALSYLLVAVFFSTDTEVRLKEETKLIEKYYSTLEEKIRILESGVEVAAQKDDQIYFKMFGSSAPNVNFFGESLYSTLPEDINEIKEQNLAHFTAITADAIKEPANRVEQNLLEVMRILESKNVLPPMSLPVKNFNYVKIGASLGMKKSPYYRVNVTHSGLDIVGVVGDKVYATDDGVVANVKLSKSGNGNTVEILHSSGHTTLYAHLDEITVRKGRNVKMGQQIGTIGISGASYAPHLHYEVRYKGVCLDPTSFFFKDLSPESYGKVYATSYLTNQSLD